MVETTRGGCSSSIGLLLLALLAGLFFWPVGVIILVVAVVVAVLPSKKYWKCTECDSLIPKG